MTLTTNQQAILAALNGYGDPAPTSYIADQVLSSVDATGKALHRLRDKGFVIAKQTKRVYGWHDMRTQRYLWRLSARGKKVFA